MIFFFNDTATTEIYTYLPTLSLHDALPISRDFGRIECIHIDRREIRLIAAASHGMLAFINAAQIEGDALFECEQREPALQLEIGERLRALQGERAGRPHGTTAVEGESVSGRSDSGGRGLIKTKNKKQVI